MISPQTSFVIFDLETTGINITSDEPIQIGIIKMDNLFVEQKRFDSFIRPSQTTELHTIVRFLTNISLNDLRKAPTIEELLPEIKHFFDENTYIVGHNPQFDIGFMKRFFDIPYKGVIDTMHLAKICFQHPQSYALEVLYDLLPQSSKHDQENIYHHALHDCVATSNVFQYCLNTIQELLIKFPSLQHYLYHSTALIKDIFTITPPVEFYDSSLPSLQKELPTPRTLNSSHKDFFEEQTSGISYNIANCSLKTLAEIICGGGKFICAFSHPSKCRIAKNIIQEIGIKHFQRGFTNPVANHEHMKLFFEKGSFDEKEIHFLLKYYAHLHQGVTIFDNGGAEFSHIYHFLFDDRNSFSSIILTSHYSLYKALEENIIPDDYTILYFDHESRYSTYPQHLKKTLDIYYLLQKCDGLLYQAKLLKEDVGLFQDFTTFLTIFGGILQTETEAIFTNDQGVELGPISEHHAFPKTSELIVTLKNYQDKISMSASSVTNDFIDISNSIVALMETVVVIRKKNSQAGTHFVYEPNVTYIDYQEFIQIFDKKKVFYFGYQDRELTIPFPRRTLSQYVHDPIIIRTEGNDTINYCQTHASVFFLTLKKTSAKKLFEFFYEKGLHQDHSLLVEHLTGSAGKLVYLAKKPGKKILIGGYEFLFEVFSHKIPIEKIILIGNTSQWVNNLIKELHYYHETY